MKCNLMRFVTTNSAHDELAHFHMGYFLVNVFSFQKITEIRMEVGTSR